MFSTVGDDSLTLHYQPLARRGGAVSGMEALMRWHHRDRGAISPEAFIPIFEKSGLIVPLSRWALGRACADAAQWPALLVVAVNLSAAQFDEDNLRLAVRSALDDSGLPSPRLELEVTDALLIEDPERKASVMWSLRDEGVKVALADFGGHRSTLSHLTDFPLSKIKIARGLIAELESSASARSIVRMIIDLGHSKGLVVAAEGIETPNQLAFLEDNGCDWFQGYLIGRPGPIEDQAMFTTERGTLDSTSASQDASLPEARRSTATVAEHIPPRAARSKR